MSPQDTMPSRSEVPTQGLPYQAPCIERVVTPAELEDEILYAGGGASAVDG